MVTVCAWCQRFLGTKEDEQVTVTHGICSPCVSRQSWEADPPVVVVSEDKQHLAPVLAQLLRGVPEVRVVVDRRASERRAGNVLAGPWVPERRSGDRRRPGGVRIV